MARWLITVDRIRSTNFNFNMKYKVSWIRGMFLGAGFTVTDYVGSYYTPLNQQRFYVEHAKESAMTLFLLQFDSSQGSLTVESV